MEQNLDPVTAYLTADRSLFTTEELAMLKAAAERFQEASEQVIGETFQ